MGKAGLCWYDTFVVSETVISSPTTTSVHMGSSFTFQPITFVKFILILIKLIQHALQPSRSGCASTEKASLHYFAASHATVEGRENIS